MAHSISPLGAPGTPVTAPASDAARGDRRTIAAVAVAVTLGVALAAVSAAWWLEPRLPTPGLAHTTTVRATPNVLVAVRDLARLESAAYHMERVVDLTDHQSRFFGLLESDDAILLVAAGEVVAGVDLAQVKDGDVTVDAEAHRARIVLPPAQILSTSLDNEHTFVHSRKTGLLAERQENLESRARAEAERTLAAAATEAHILDRARTNATRTVESLVRSLGFDTVEVTVREP